MPFLNPDRRPAIRHPQGHPVAVIAVFNTIGDFVPKYFSVEDDNSKLFKFKIAKIHVIRDQYMVRVFFCAYEAYGRLNNIKLCYDIMLRRWVIE